MELVAVDFVEVAVTVADGFVAAAVVVGLQSQWWSGY